MTQALASMLTELWERMHAHNSEMQPYIVSTLWQVPVLSEMSLSRPSLGCKGWKLLSLFCIPHYRHNADYGINTENTDICWWNKCMILGNMSRYGIIRLLTDTVDLTWWYIIIGFIMIPGRPPVCSNCVTHASPTTSYWWQKFRFGWKFRLGWCCLCPFCVHSEFTNFAQAAATKPSFLKVNHQQYDDEIWVNMARRD